MAYLTGRTGSGMISADALSKMSGRGEDGQFG
jgi:hypothetical protein